MISMNVLLHWTLVWTAPPHVQWGKDFLAMVTFYTLILWLIWIAVAADSFA